MLQALTWTDITETLSDDQDGQTRYYSLNSRRSKAFEAACHFQEYLDLMNVLDSVRQGKEPVPGLVPFVAFIVDVNLRAQSLNHNQQVQLFVQ